MGMPIRKACWRNAPMVRSSSLDMTRMGVPFSEYSWSLFRLCIVHGFRFIFLPFAIRRLRKEAST
jgi:hypothetical protein